MPMFSQTVRRLKENRQGLQERQTGAVRLPDEAARPELAVATQDSLARAVAEPVVEAGAEPVAAHAAATMPAGWWPLTKELARFLSQTEVHTYAFSVAANVIFSLFPFIVLMLTITEKVFHSRAMADAIRDMLGTLLPLGGSLVYRNMAYLVHPGRGTRLFSVFMLLITSTGVFLPLEVALNEVWGVKKHRNYLQNQLVSLGLAAAVGILVLGSVAATAGQHTLMSWIFFEHTDNVVFSFLARGVLELFAIVAGILMFFLIYWILPHRKIPARAVLPTAIVVGLSWEVAKYLYVLALPKLDFVAVYGPFATAVGLMMWAFLSALLLLAGAHFSAMQHRR